MGGEWADRAIDELMDAIIDYRGKTPKKSNSGIPLITAKIIKGGRIDEPSEFIAIEEYDDWMRRGSPKAGDVLITTEAPMGEVAQLSSANVALAQRVILLRGKESLLDNSFLKFVLQSSTVQHRLRARESGTTVTGIKQKELRKVLIPTPPLPEQKRIASVLGALDDKIELNHKMNKTLEAMAQAIFKSWFIDFDWIHQNQPSPLAPLPEGEGDGECNKSPLPLGEGLGEGGVALVVSELGPIPKGWEESTVGKEFKLIMGQSPPGNTYNKDGEGMPFFQGATDFGFRFPTSRVFCTEPKRIAEAGDTLISVRAPVGRPNMATEQCCLGRGVASMRHNSGSLSFTFGVAKALEHRFESFNAEGTVFGSINKKDFERLPVIKPPSYIVQDFDSLVSSLDQKIEINEHQSRTITLIRDALLPKLISGEIRVPNAEDQLEELE